MASAASLLDLSDKHHVMLLYDNADDRNTAEIESVKKALDMGQFCVYASIDMHDKTLFARFKSKIPSCDEHLENGNLMIVDFKPFYESALAGSLYQFQLLHQEIEKILRDRSLKDQSTKTLIIADAACHLVRNKHFGEAAKLETWWQETYTDWVGKGLDISIICSHSALAIKENSQNIDASKISHMHSWVLYLDDIFAILPPPPPSPSHKLLRVLVAESEEDMQSIYRWAFGELSVLVEIVGNGKQCCDKALSKIESELRGGGGKEEEERNGATAFDVVIVDTHLEDISGIKIVQKILERLPNQKIIITTSNEELIHPILDTTLPTKSSEISVLSKPFEFSRLLALLKPIIRKRDC